MGGIANFCQSNLPLIYGLYGLAFFVTGVAVALECGRASQLALNRALPFLAAFALMHGLHEWIEMYGLMVPVTPYTHMPSLIDATNIILLGGSFVCLMEFALRLMRLLEPDSYAHWGWLTGFITGLYLVATLAFRLWGWSGDESLFWRVADILSRYILGLAGAVLACWAMFVQRRAFQSEGYPQFSADFIGAALAFSWYALFQVVAPPSPYFPSSVVNTDTFLSTTGIPVQLFRVVIVAVLAFFIIRTLRVFEAEYTRRLDALNHARFAAQENAARELSVLYETCRIMGTTLDLNFLLHEALNRMVTLIEPICGGSVFLYDAQERALAPRASFLNPTSYTPTDFGTRMQNLAQRAFTQKEIAYEPAGNPDSFLAIPLTSGGDTIGALCLVHNGPFSNLAVLQTLARQLTIAIENVRLYEEVQNKEVLRGQLLERVVVAQEDERKRLARDLHDQTGQRLTALGLAVSSVGELMDKNPGLAHERLIEVEGMCTSAIDDLRQFVSDLRPSLLDDLGLVAALRQMAKQTQERSRIAVEFSQVGARRRLPSQLETVVYRIAQEALNNTVRHARATRASIELVFGNDHITLKVQDNGQGFNPATVLGAHGPVRAWGLLGMQERVELVGGRFEIQSAPGQGTRLVAEIPLEKMEAQVVHSGHAG